MKIGLDYILTSFLVRSSIQNFGHIYSKRGGMLADVQESLNDILRFVVFEESRNGGEKKTGILVLKKI